MKREERIEPISLARLLHVERYGSSKAGPPILFLHGFGASSECWHDILPALIEGGHDVYLVDLLGFGRARSPADGLITPERQSAAVVELVATSGLKNVCIAGHSYGGVVALLVALELSTSHQKIAKLVIIDAPGRIPPLPFFVRFLRLGIVSRALLSLTSAAFRSRFTLKRLYARPKSVTPRLVERYARHSRARSARAALLSAAEHVYPVAHHRITSQLSRDLRLPTLVVWGAEDPIFPIRYGQELAAAIPDAQFAVICDCGHVPQEEQPAALMKVLIPFLHDDCHE